MGRILLRVSGIAIELLGSDGVSGNPYFTLASPDATLPQNQWTVVATNVLSTSCDFILNLNHVWTSGPAPDFFLLKSK